MTNDALSIELGIITNRFILWVFIAISIVLVLSSVGQLWWLVISVSTQSTTTDTTPIVQHLLMLKRIDVQFRAILVVTGISLVNCGGLVMCLIGTSAMQLDGRLRVGSVSIGALVPVLLLILSGVALAMGALYIMPAGTGASGLIPNP